VLSPASSAALFHPSLAVGLSPTTALQSSSTESRAWHTYTIQTF